MQELSGKFTSVAPEIKSFAVIEYDNKFAQHEHRSRYHELLCILSGNMTLHLDRNLRFDAIPGDLLLIPAETLHRDEFPLRKGLRVLYISFDWNMQEYFSEVDNRTLINLNYDIRSEVLRRLEFMRATWSDAPEAVKNAAVHLHSIILLLYMGVMQEQKPPLEQKKNPLRENMRRAKHFIDQNYSSQITLADAAEFVSISPPYFSRLFHNEFGVGFSAYLTAVRLNSAKHYLQNTPMQIAEIADICGFTSSSYFIKVFTRHFGISPKNYSRSLYRNKQD